MNKVNQLLDKNYITQLLREKVLPHYPDFIDIRKVRIHAHKEHIWEETYHVVFEYTTTFITRDGKLKKLPIFCSAHSNEPRRNVHDALVFLWGHGFDRGYLSVPHPLFYSEYFQATFYRGVSGKHLYHYIRNQDYGVIESMIPKAAKWFAKLHDLPTTEARNFNPENSRIESVIPGIAHILLRILDNYPEYLPFFTKVFGILNEREKHIMGLLDRQWLVHGDAHPENIIRMSPRKLAVIDYTDICFSDYTRDLGTFLQQLEYMCERKGLDSDYIDSLKQMFLDAYFRNSRKRELTKAVQKRINNYYYWTAMRTATHLLLKDEAEPERAYRILKKVWQQMKLQKEVELKKAKKTRRKKS